MRVLTCAAPSQSVVGLTVYEWPDDEEVGWDSARFRSRAPVIGDVDLSLTAVLSPAWQPVQEIEEGPPRRTLRPVGGFRTDSSYSISATVAGPASDRHLTLDVVFTAADLEALPVGRWLHAGSGSEETGAPPVTSSDPAALRDAACEGWTEGRTVTA
ncbi:hypothetical protein [Aeromicrobium sp. JJY06]|uniref:hypothetical protein n=1 Tax=Aeromicrobium sp. JJY06 TaxID=3373478 RepID=UPI00376EE12E